MAKSNADYRADDLEITSIGSLYKGPWDKKYWSSSRGKDRYPYPIGYQAVRAHNGGSHKMEIREGPKGPLFVSGGTLQITAKDGRSCSGQTPDIAWDNFQKKGFPRNWHGKRLSCKIDGVEFFGFKNPLVQRLLRELVANVDGTAESGMFASTLCNEASRSETGSQCSDTCIYPVLPPYLIKPEIKRKRSKRPERINSKSTGEVTLKKPRSQRLADNVSASNSLQAQKNNHALAEDGVLSASLNFHDHPSQKAVPAQEESYNISKASGITNGSSADKLLGRSQVAEVEGFNFAMETEDKNDDAVVAKDSLGIDDVDLCAPDTLDITQDTIYEYASSALDKRIYSNSKEGISASGKLVSGELISEPHPEEEMGVPNSNDSSESVADEMAKSMMTLLLPQAIPLLKKPSRKKKATVGSSETMPCHANSREEMNDTGYVLDFPSPSCMLTENAQVQNETEMHIQSTDLAGVARNLVETKLVVPDSYEDTQCVSRADNQNESICLDETNKSKDICYNEVDIKQNEMPDENHVYKHESSEVKDVCSSMNKNSAGSELHSNGNHTKTEPDSAEASGTSDTNVRGVLDSLQLSEKENNANTGNAETQNMSLSQVQHLVYTRKRISKKTCSKQNYDCPLSESIVYRNSGDGTATRILLATGANQIRSDDKQHNIDLLSTEGRLGMSSQGLNTEITNMKPIGLPNNVVQGLFQNQSFAHSSKDEDTSDILNPTVLFAEKSQDHFVEELVGQKNQEELQCSLSSQKQGASMGANASCIKEVEAGTDLSAHLHMELDNELECYVDLVGRYAHPVPVTSLLVSARGPEVYICVLCGLSVDTERMLFMYRVKITEPTKGCPSLVGHTPVRFPTPKYNFGREIAVERSSFQFTPDGQCLVLLDTIRAPCCREGRMDCLCSTCTSACFKENSVKIVQVNHGYISVMTKLKAFEGVQSILVCEPNHLIAVGESGRLHIWVMNSTWSAQIEEFVMPANDCTPPGIVELKRLPKCASYIVGHDGFGEFSIWDISQRILLSRFSAPTPSVYQFIPITVFSWQRKDDFLKHYGTEEHINRITATTRMRSLEHSEGNSFLPLDGEDIAVWLLVSTAPDTEAEHNHILSDSQKSPVGWWRLALLTKKSVIFGSALDTRAAAVGASMGQGIMGTCDGLVYMWEPATGTKLRTLHDFKGGSVSCIATDDSAPGVLAVAGNGGQLLVYTCSQKNA